MLKTAAAGVICFLLAGAMPLNAAESSDFLAPGDHSIILKHGGRERSAIVHVPPTATDNRELAVVLNFHGGGGHGANQQEYSLMDRLADREGFITVYPNGTGRFAKRLLTWNAGTCCGYAALNNVDDVGFVRALIGKLAESVPIDRRRIYATGLSNGGMMAHRLAAEAGDMIAAVAPVAGGMVLPAIKSPRAVPVMHIHSVDDPRALYNGGLGPPFPLTNSRVLHPSIDQVISLWVKHNGCSVARRWPSAAPIMIIARTQQRIMFMAIAEMTLRWCFGNSPVPATSGPAARANFSNASSAHPPISSTPIKRCGTSSNVSRFKIAQRPMV